MTAPKMTMKERERVEMLVYSKIKTLRTAVQAAIEKKKSMLKQEVEKEFAPKVEKIADARAEVRQELTRLNADFSKAAQKHKEEEQQLGFKERGFDDRLLVVETEIKNEVEKRLAEAVGTQREIEVRLDEKANEIRVSLWAFTPEAKALIGQVPTIDELKKDGLGKILPPRALNEVLALVET